MPIIGGQELPRDCSHSITTRRYGTTFSIPLCAQRFLSFPTSSHAYPLSLHAHLLPSLRKHLPHPPRQLISDQPGKHHDILRRISAALNHVPQRWSLVALRPQVRSLVRKTNHGPDHRVADRASKHWRRDVEGLSLGADDGGVAASVVFEGKDIGGADGL